MGFGRYRRLIIIVKIYSEVLVILIVARKVVERRQCILGMVDVENLRSETRAVSIEADKHKMGLFNNTHLTVFKPCCL